MDCSDARGEASPDPADDWFEGSEGNRHWGLFGAAGLLVYRGGEVLLQLRGPCTHNGGTWGLPGGARKTGEAPAAAAWREGREEAGLAVDTLRPRWWSIADHGGWAYTTLAAEAPPGANPLVDQPNWETSELRWVALDQVAEHNLHPGFARAWPVLRPLVGAVLTLIVDAANVVGSRPDGWWRDRAGAAVRLRGELEGLAATGLANIWTETPNGWYPELVMVVEGQARGIGQGRGVAVVDAPGEGDDQIVAQAQTAAKAGKGPVLVATADKGLIARLPRGGVWPCAALPPARLKSLLPEG